MDFALRIALFGPPGAGKGTQAQLLKDRLGLTHISSGDLFRFHLQEGTSLGARASEFMSKGLLVPDELVIEMVLDKVLELGEESGFILDGFPRTREQAVALDEALAERSRGLDSALLVDVPANELVRRLSGRFVCRSCQAPHNLEAASRECPHPVPGAAGNCFKGTTTAPRQSRPELSFTRNRRNRCWTFIANGNCSWKSRAWELSRRLTGLPAKRLDWTPRHR